MDGTMEDLGGKLGPLNLPTWNAITGGSAGFVAGSWFLWAPSRSSGQDGNPWNPTPQQPHFSLHDPLPQPNPGPPSFPQRQQVLGGLVEQAGAGPASWAW